VLSARIDVEEHAWESGTSPAAGDALQQSKATICARLVAAPHSMDATVKPADGDEKDALAPEPRREPAGERRPRSRATM